VTREKTDDAKPENGARSEKLGGNADVFEKKGVEKIATQKTLKTKELEIDGTDIRPQRRCVGRGRKCAEEWESDSDGGLGTSLFALYATAKWRCVSGLPRTCDGDELGREVPS
jgi:hypothetical protein